MTRGPKPKPAELRERQGNPGRRPIPDAAKGGETLAEALGLEVDDPVARELGGAVLDPDEIEAPDGVPPNLNGLAALAWRSIVGPYLQNVRWIKKTDQPLLERLCVWTGEFWSAYKHVREHGAVYETRSKHSEKMFRPNPAVEMMRKAEDRISALEQRLGVDPSARMRLAIQFASGTVKPPETSGAGRGDGGELGDAEGPARSPVGLLN